MLVLSRKKNEQIVIAVPGFEPITLTIVDIRGDKVRVGIEADAQIPVHRQEIWLQIQQADGEAAQAVTTLQA
jgi:carbon storage regulator